MKTTDILLVALAIAAVYYLRHRAKKPVSTQAAVNNAQTVQNNTTTVEQPSVIERDMDIATWVANS